MKSRVLTVIAILVLSVPALQAQVSFGLVAGPNFQNLTGKDHDGDKMDNGLIVSFHAGVQASIPIAKDFYFQPGLLYSGKGSKNNLFIIVTKAASDEFNVITHLSYLELPLNLLFRPELANGHILLGFGPYIAYGIGGNQAYEAGSLTLDQEIKFKNSITLEEFWDIDQAYYRPFDAGVNIFAGYELEMGLFFQINAQLGLLNINPEITDIDEGDDEAAYKNTGFGLSVGYNF